MLKQLSTVGFRVQEIRVPRFEQEPTELTMSVISGALQDTADLKINGDYSFMHWLLAAGQKLVFDKDRFPRSSTRTAPRFVIDNISEVDAHAWRVSSMKDGAQHQDQTAVWLQEVHFPDKNALDIVVMHAAINLERELTRQHLDRITNN